MPTADDIYRKLIEPIEDRMIRTIARITRDPDDAEDTLQNALAAIWTDFGKICRHPNPHGYILRVCISAAYDTLRKRRRRERRESPMEFEVVSSGGPESTLLIRESERAVIQAISSLPRQQAEAVLLRVLGDEPFDSIASALACSEATARSHVSKGKARLREILSDLDRNLVTEER